MVAQVPFFNLMGGGKLLMVLRQIERRKSDLDYTNSQRKSTVYENFKTKRKSLFSIGTE